MLVDVGRNRHSAVTEPAAEHTGRDARGQGQRGVGVPEIVESHGGQTRGTDQTLETAADVAAASAPAGGQVWFVGDAQQAQPVGAGGLAPT